MRKRKESSEIKVKREELIQGIFLEHYQKTIEEKNIYLLKVESQNFQIMDLAIDLTASKNITLSDSPDLVKKVRIDPFTKATVAKIVLGKKWSLVPKFAFKMSHPPLESQRKLIEPYNLQLTEKIEAFKRFGNIDFRSFPPETTLAYFTKNKFGFIDSEFPPVSSSLCADPLFFESRHKCIHQWRRAKYLYYPSAKANQPGACPPVLFSHEFRQTLLKSIQKEASSRFIPNNDPKTNVDDSQNILDNAYLDNSRHNLAFMNNEGLDPGLGVHDWMTVAFMAIKSHPDLLKNIFLTNRPNSQGFYLIKLHVMGRKSIMQLDDYIPCLPFDGPLFMGKGSEIKPDFGFLLLEKAFAKKRGSYYNLKNGSISNCLVDLTGSPVIEVPLKDGAEIVPDELWGRIEYWMASKYMVIVEQHQAEDERNYSQIAKASIAKHSKRAYFILSGIEVDENGMRIVKLSMKPQTATKIDALDIDDRIKAKGEKRGPLEPIDLIDIDLTPSELPIPFPSLYKSFQKLIVAKTTYKEKLRVKGKFVSRSMTDKANLQNQNLISRWFYKLELKHYTKLTIGLHQEDENWIGVRETRPNIDMGFVVLREDKNGLSIQHYQPPNIKREIFAELEFERGSYIVLPLTIGIYNKDDALKLGITSHDKKNPIVVSVVRDIFEKLNMSGSDFLTFAELKNFYKSLSLGSLSQKDFQSIIAKYSSGEELGVNDPEGLSEKAFVELFFNLLEVHKTKSNDGRNFFNALGYDETLFSVSSRIFTMTVHSDKYIDIDWRDIFKDNVEARVFPLLLEKFGKKVETFKDDEEGVFPVVLANE